MQPKVPEDNDFFAFKRDRNATVAKMMSPPDSLNQSDVYLGLHLSFTSPVTETLLGLGIAVGWITPQYQKTH